MFDDLIKNLKRNMRAVVFIGIMFFFIGNYAFSQVQKQQETKNVLILLDTIVNDISSTFNNVSDSTLIYDLAEPSFQKVSGTLTSLSTRLTNYRIKIPFDKGTKEYTDVTSKLSSLIQISQKQSDQFAELYNLYGENLASLQNYTSVSTLPDQTSKTEAKKLTTIWKTIGEIEKKELIKYHDIASKDFYTKLNETNLKIAIDLETQLDQSPELINLQSLKPQLEELNSTKYAVFPRLKKEEIQSPEFAQTIADLDKAVDKLKQAERIG